MERNPQLKALIIMEGIACIGDMKKLIDDKSLTDSVRKALIRTHKYMESIQEIEFPHSVS